MEDWQTKQAKFDQLPVDVETINYAINHLNTMVTRLGDSTASLEADIHIVVMLLSRVEQCVQQQTQTLNQMRDALVSRAETGEGGG